MNPFNNLTDKQNAARQKENAILCAKYFHRKGSALVKDKIKMPDFEKWDIAFINKWLHEVTDSLGINQFSNQKVK